MRASSWKGKTLHSYCLSEESGGKLRGCTQLTIFLEDKGDPGAIALVKTKDRSMMNDF
ncbi:MAG: hypothetical protein ACYTXE_37630 [Nostoc sp.]